MSQSSGVTVTGCGSAVPRLSVSNDHLSEIVETSDEWIASRTGIRTRQLAGEGESTSSLAAAAAQRALEMAQVDPQTVDLILLATSTPDDLFGSSSQVQAQLGASQAVAFDITAACSGFIVGLSTAAQFIYSGAYKTVVLIGADVLSRWVDWGDRRTCVLFGDGAGAVVLQAGEQDGLLGFELRSDGTQYSCLTLPYQGEGRSHSEAVTTQLGGFQPINMNGQEVYRFAVRQVPEVIEKAIYRAGLAREDIDWLLLHQANQRILDAVAKRLKVPSERVISNMAAHGNTSAASIPLALDEWVRQGKIQPGDIIAAAGFGAGLTWGATLFRWGQL
ncbi:MAG: beta-ketoacyl-ACP synthase III [Cyanobacteria bacterium P01_A01_bin.135]